MKDVTVTKIDSTTCKVVMTTKKARRAMRKATGNDREQISEDQILNNDQLHKILSWAISWDLTMDSDVSIIIPARTDVMDDSRVVIPSTT